LRSVPAGTAALPQNSMALVCLVPAYFALAGR